MILDRAGFLLIVCILAINLACNTANPYEIPNQEAERIARLLIKRADSSFIDTFKQWSYGRRGDYEFWLRLDEGDVLYGIGYYPDNREIHVSATIIDNFNCDFPMTIALDTSRYRMFEFKPLDNNVQIRGEDSSFRNRVVHEGIPRKKLFQVVDPFDHFEHLNQVKDDFGLWGTSYRPDIGEFVMFWLSTRHVLTYLPDTASFDPWAKKRWMKYFEKGTAIEKDWNLRTFEKEDK